MMALLTSLQQAIVDNATATATATAAATAANAAANAATAAATAATDGGGTAHPSNTSIIPYTGAALNLSSKIGSHLYLEAKKPLSCLFTGKPDTFLVFLQELKERIEECEWNSTAHGIFTINKNSVDYNILEDYGRLTFLDVELARAARELSEDDRAKQNAKVMYISLFATCDDDTKKSFSTLDLHRDGPTILLRMLKSTFTANFQHAQYIRQALHKVRPKTFGYDIPKLNNDLKFKFEMVRAGSPKQDATNFDPEFSFYLYQAYESIKSPLAWIQFIINMKQETARGTKTIISAMKMPSST